MCINYKPTTAEELAALTAILNSYTQIPSRLVWKKEVWQDYQAPIIRAGEDGGPEVLLGTYGMIPKDKMPPGVRFSTMNARAETIGEKKSYAKAWRAAQTCLLPTACFYEPNWETGSAERWAIGMADDSPFCVAGLWRTWGDENDLSYSFTQITVNAGDHPLMKRFHKQNEEKRSVVILPRHEWSAWLDARDPEVARSMLRLYPAEAMKAWPAAKGYHSERKITEKDQ